MTILAIVLVILLLLIISTSLWLFTKLDLEYKTRAKRSVEDVFASHSFEKDSMLVVSNKLIIALNKHFNKIAIVENFNPDIPDIYNYSEIKANTIANIENSGFVTKINFKQDDITNTLAITSFSKEAKEFCHNLLAKILFHKLEIKYPDFKFNYFATSDWECSYIWAYDSTKSAFAYLSSLDLKKHQLLNLRKEFFTIDTDYNYLELPLMNQPSQLLMYEKNFLNKLFLNLYETIKTHITCAVTDKIFYDNYNNILYLSNSISSLQSLILDRIEDVFYRENRLQFTMRDDKKVINFIADKEFIEEFEKFVIGYNLRKIANSFDYKTDKLINVNSNTKFIVDITRDRVVYCANLNKFYSFSYMTIAFSNLESAEVIKTASRIYVRIKTKDEETLDVTCLKSEVAYYVKAQIDCIINGE